MQLCDNPFLSWRSTKFTHVKNSRASIIHFLVQLGMLTWVIVFIVQWKTYQKQEVARHMTRVTARAAMVDLNNLIACNSLR